MTGGDDGNALAPARDLERAYRFHEGIEPKCSMLPLRRENDYPHQAALPVLALFGHGAMSY
jgi:hypothetical protein